MSYGIAETPSLRPFTDKVYLAVIPGAYKQRESLHKRLGDARGRVTHHIASPYRGSKHMGAAIYEWSDTFGTWGLLHEFPPGDKIDYEQLPWKQKA